MGRKVSDGKSVRVTVPENTTVEQGAFALLDGFLGLAAQKVVTGAGETKGLVLNIEPGEYETSQIDATQDFAVGTKIYWDSTAKKFTETPTAVLAGVVTLAKDAGGVIWFRVAPGIINDEAATAIGTMTALTTTEKSTLVEAINEVDAHADEAATAIGTMTALTTTEKSTLVEAINEVDAHADAANAAIGTMTALTTTEKSTLVEAINEVDTAAAAAQADATTALARVAAKVACAEAATDEEVRTALRALLTALQAAGLMAAE